MSKASEAAKARRNYLKEYEPEKYAEYLQQQRLNSKKAFDKKSPEEKRNVWRSRRRANEAGDYRKYERIAWRHVIRGMKERAALKEIPFDDTIDIDYLISITPTVCPVLGIPLVRCNRLNPNRQSSPSVDRIVPEKGYVKGNILIVSYFANTIRNAATPEQILTVGLFYKNLLESMQ